MDHQQQLDRFKRDLTLKGFSPKTRETYYRNLAFFLERTAIPADEITAEHVKDYLYQLITERDLSDSSIKQARSAISFFFTVTMNRPIAIETVPRRIKARTLPTVFSIEETARIINSAANMKHRTMLMLAYSSGLRVGELVELTPADIRRDIMRIIVRQGKGHRDRCAILARACLKELETYYRTYRPERWLFNGRTRGERISVRAIQHAFEAAKKKAGVTRPGGIHSLRHSFATHLLEAGGGIFQLQKFLGHKHLQTTLIYAHIREEKVIAQSPFDVFNNVFSADR